MELFAAFIATVALLVRLVSAQTNGGVCSVPLSKQERMNRVGANILDQMGLSKAPENPKVPVLLKPEKMEEFKLLERTLGVKKDEEDSPPATCTDAMAFARRKTTFSASDVAIPERTNTWKYDYGELDLLLRDKLTVSHTSNECLHI